ncbi:hypothetical protein [Streptomyces sp. NBC_00847]|uniref:hypothetical protein n=1 Tax=unclassified Streptomyces TaxID=2593676 RepID=UPI002251C616|nr:hypothetical protein [Streptomyces sp. NBC_00847]MCX4882191.1 hypothetical protein [Streptomyces sp. NBC_00847]
MRDAIARALVWVLSVLPGTRRPQPGRHSAAFFAEQPAVTPEPTPANPWSRPWTGPTKEEAQELFRRQAKTALELRLTHDRRRAAALASIGVDYPYTYEGAPFPASAFEAARAIA